MALVDPALRALYDLKVSNKQLLRIIISLKLKWLLLIYFFFKKDFRPM